VLTITSSLWETALVRPVEDSQTLHLGALPESTRQCFTSEVDVSFQILPQKLAADPLVAIPGSISRAGGASCFQLPEGEQLEVMIDGARGSFKVDGAEQALPISG